MDYFLHIGEETRKDHQATQQMMPWKAESEPCNQRVQMGQRASNCA